MYTLHSYIQHIHLNIKLFCVYKNPTEKNPQHTMYWIPPNFLSRTLPNYDGWGTYSVMCGPAPSTPL